MARCVGMILAVILTAAVAVSAQELSTEVYPSEDELLEALQRGEIDRERYEILLEILREGIDSSTVHLFDEIPNLSGRAPGGGESRLSAEQAEAFVERRTRVRRAAMMSYRYAQEMEREGRGVYQSTFTLFPTQRWEVSMRLDRSLSGRERVAGRYARYRPAKGTVREIVFGTFTRRLGLGTVAGYRGEIVESSEELDIESALFPDYGGQNGGYVRLAHGEWRTEGMVSVQRDEEVSLVTAAGMSSREMGRGVRMGAIAGYNRMENRVTGEGIDDVKAGGVAEYNRKGNSLKVEVTGQVGGRSGFGAAVFEAGQRGEGRAVRLGGWHYGHGYLDLSGGSKAGAITVTDTIDGIGVGVRTKRTGSSGGWMRSSVDVAAGVTLETGGTLAVFSADTMRAEMMAGVAVEVGQKTQLRADVLSRRTRKREEAGEEDDLYRQVRLEGRYDGVLWSGRAAVGHVTDETGDDRWSLFGRGRFEAGTRGHFEVWVNLGRVDMTRGMIEYSYSYIRCSQVLRRGIEGAFKVAHRYSRGSEEAHMTTVALEVRAEI